MKARYNRHKENISRFKETFFDNFSFKLVSLIIALILWLSLLNKRDFIATKEFDVDIVTAENLVVMTQSVDKLRVKVSGPQPLLKKFKSESQVVAFDMSERPPGFYDIDVGSSRIEVPKGLKIIAIRPSSIRVEISEIKKENKKEE